MKRLLSIIMLVAIAISAWAFETGDYAYSVLTEPSGGQRGTLECTGLSAQGKAKSSIEAHIPYLVTYNNKNYYVTRVGVRAFYGQKNVTTMRLSYGIERISTMAFMGCEKLSSVRIPSSVKTIGSQIFDGNTQMQAVYMAHLNASGLDIAGDAFNSSKSITLNVPRDGSVSSYEAYTQFGTTYFTSINESSDAYDFSAKETNAINVVVNTPSTSASTPSKVTIIGTTDDKETVKVPATLSIPSVYDRTLAFNVVASYAFHNHPHLKTLDMSEATNIQYIGTLIADSCSNLQTVNIKTGSCLLYLFTDCPSLSSVTLGDGVKFERNWYVSSSFWRCPALKRFNIDENNPYMTAYYGVAYTKDKKTLLCVPEGYAGASSVVFTPNVEEIGRGALRGNNFTSIFIPWGVTTIDDYAFRGCSKLKEVFIPSSVKEIGEYLFTDCMALTDLYVNSPTPFTVNQYTFTDYITPQSVPRCNLYVPRGMVDAYKAAGWTGFLTYNSAEDAIMPYDNAVNTMGFTVTSTKPEVINGTQYAGRAKVVRSKWNSYIDMSATVPPSITLRGKEYAVTKIDNYAFNTDKEYSLRNCANVDTVGAYACGNQKVLEAELPYVSVIENSAFGTKYLKNVTWGNRLRKIGRYGFSAAPIENDIILPVGFEELGYRAFEQAKSKVLLLPSTLKTIDSQAFNKIKSVDTIIVNTTAALASSASFAFTEVPTSAKVFVPATMQSTARAHKSWKRFSTIEEGAYDFAYRNDKTSNYKMTVVDPNPVTVDGVTYAGKAHYVYNSGIKTMWSFTPDDYETDQSCGGNRKYLMVGFGDRFGVLSNIAEVDFSRIPHLNYIGHSAFLSSKLKSAVLPANDLTIGTTAFYGCADLTELVIPYSDKMVTTNGRIYGDNASNFNCYVENTLIYEYLDKFKEFQYNSSETGDTRVAPCFQADAATYNLGAVVPLDFAGTGLNAYVITDANASTGILTTKKLATQLRKDRGVIITDLTPGTLYKVPRWLSPYNNGVVSALIPAGRNRTNVYASANTYYWDKTRQKFIRPTSTYWEAPGKAYLAVPDSRSEYYLDILQPSSSKTGDVNGDGTVDVTDVNLAINVMLGKSTKAQYPAADVNGDGTVDVTDVNLIINAMLGK